MKFDEKFRQTRRLVSLWKFALEQIADIKTEQDNAVERLVAALGDMEDNLKEKGVDIELTHLAHFAEFLDDKRAEFYRKKILDHGNNLKREIEAE